MASKTKTFTAVVDTLQVVTRDPMTLTGYYIYNPNASTAFLQLFDVAGTATLGTTAPNLCYGVPASAAANQSGLDRHCTNGLQLAATTTATGSTPVGTGLVVTMYFES